MEWGLGRTQEFLRRHDLAAALLADPVNVRYVTGTSVMPVWTLHSIDRYVLVPAVGEPVLWEYASAPAVSSPYPSLQVRTATSWSVFGSGEHGPPPGPRAFAAEVTDVLREWGVRDGRIGVDRLDAYGFLALQEAGLHLVPAQLALEQARAVKGPDEIALIRALGAGRRRGGLPAVRGPAPGHDRERDLGSLRRRRLRCAAGSTSSAACCRRARGPTRGSGRPASAAVERGDLVSFDTDLIGPAGYLADLSRTYVVGIERSRRPGSVELYADAEAFLAEIIGELKPGTAFDEAGERLSRRFPAKYHAQRYPFIAHGSGLSDEYPVISFADHHDGEIEAGMVFSVEAYSAWRARTRD